MKFKFVKSLDLIRAGENIVIDGFTYYVESMHPTKRSAIIANQAVRLQLIVNNNPIIEEIKND